MTRSAVNPEDKTTPVNVSIPFWMAVALRKKAAREERSVSAIVRRALINDGLLR